jgi:hypothetical protein
VVLEVRRDDGELCGYVAPQEDRWRSLTTFGAVLGEHDSENESRQHAADLGLSALADRWTLIDRSTGEEELVCIQQVSPVEGDLISRSRAGSSILPFLKGVTIAV